MGPGGLDGVRELFESVAAHEEHVGGAPLADLGEHAEPELGPLAAGDFEAAAAIAVPRIEAAVRSLLLAAGHPLYRTQRAKAPGQYPGLGALLSSAPEVGLDESWLRFLSTFLTSGPGLNFRNELAHDSWWHQVRQNPPTRSSPSYGSCRLFRGSKRSMAETRLSLALKPRQRRRAVTCRFPSSRDTANRVSGHNS